jgi:prolyl-tRNA synthetase
MVIADTGEDQITFCSACDYAANVDKTPCHFSDETELVEEGGPLEERVTPEARTVQDVASYLGVDTDRVIKSVFYNVEGKLVVVLVQGDRLVNEIKVMNYLGISILEPADPEEMLNNYGIPMGFAGPVYLRDKTDVTILADSEIKNLSNAVAGANKTDYHYINVNPGEDTSK